MPGTAGKWLLTEVGDERGRKWGQTDYRISAIPLGGYVKLGGDESNAPLEGESAPDIPPEEMFNLRPRWQRICVALAGPVMNVLTALAIPFAGAMMYGANGYSLMSRKYHSDPQMR